MGSRPRGKLWWVTPEGSPRPHCPPGPGAGLLSCCLRHTCSRSEQTPENMAQGLPSPQQGRLCQSRCSNALPSTVPRRALGSSPGLSACTPPLAAPRDLGHGPRTQPGASRWARSHQRASWSPVPGLTGEVWPRGCGLTSLGSQGWTRHQNSSRQPGTHAECTRPEQAEPGGRHPRPGPLSEREGSGHSGFGQAGLTPMPSANTGQARPQWVPVGQNRALFETPTSHSPPTPPVGTQASDSLLWGVEGVRQLRPEGGPHVQACGCA